MALGAHHKKGLSNCTCCQGVIQERFYELFLQGATAKVTSLVPCTHVEKPRQHLGENPSIEKWSFVKAPVSFPAAKVRRRPKRCAECLPSNRVREKGRKQGPPRSQGTVLRGPPLLLGFLLAKLDESRDAHTNSRHATGKNSSKLCEVETIRPVAEEDFSLLTALDIRDQGTFGLYKGREALEQCLELKRKWHRAQSFVNSIEEARPKSEGRTGEDLEMWCSA